MVLKVVLRMSHRGRKEESHFWAKGIASLLCPNKNYGIEYKTYSNKLICTAQCTPTHFKSNKYYEWGIYIISYKIKMKPQFS